MFSLHDFVFKTIRDMLPYENAYQVRKYALTWYQKSVLTDDDMTTIDNWYTVDTSEPNKEEGAE